MSVAGSVIGSDLQALVHELSKSNPNINRVKDKTDILGIPYNPDLITLMSEVLVYLSKNSPSKNSLQSTRPDKNHQKQLKDKSV